ncbi:MAG: glycosyltransferase family 4 protein [Lentisphaerae bacterium]|nr:glycosyltransferase family 4 protein [Lentisphaerota bacterium]
MKQAISLWCRYGELGASSRLRFRQFVPELQKAGFAVDTHNFFSDDYLKKLYSGKGKSKTAFFSALCRRFKELLALPQDRPLLIEYELLPFIPWAIEKLFIGKRRYILNFDDAVDLRYRKIPFLRGKYPELIAHAAGVIVANDELMERFARYNSNIFKLPTVPPPPPESRTMPPEKGELIRIGWIGTPVTYAFLQKHTETLQKMFACHPFELLVIAREDLPPIPGIPAKYVNWSASGEHALLQSCQLGIMPLDDSEFAKGKSAFKLIQYLRAGIPAIASATGENLNVIRQGKTGFCAGSSAEWAAAWQQLADEKIRQEMAPEIAREAEKFSFENNSVQLLKIINSILKPE